MNDRVLEVNKVTKSFGGNKAVSDVTFSLNKGAITALIGTNGAGKTTLFNLISGFIRPDYGSLMFLGQNVTNKLPYERARAGIVRTFQNLRLFLEMSVIENTKVAIPKQNSNLTRAQEIIDFVGLGSVVNKQVSDLSYGEQKLVAMARAIATDGDLFLLDELMAGLDENWLNRIQQIITTLNEKGKTICLIEHNLNVVRSIAHRVIFMSDGKILKEGATEEVLSDQGLRSVYLGN